MRLATLVLALAMSVPAAAHSDTIFHVDPTGLVSGLPDEFGPIFIHADYPDPEMSGVDPPTMRVVIRGHETVIPPCVMEVARGTRWQDVRVYGSWYHRRSGLPPYMSISISAETRRVLLFNLESGDLLRDVTRRIGRVDFDELCKGPVQAETSEPGLRDAVGGSARTFLLNNSRLISWLRQGRAFTRLSDFLASLTCRSCGAPEHIAEPTTPTPPPAAADDAVDVDAASPVSPPRAPTWETVCGLMPEAHCVHLAFEKGHPVGIKMFSIRPGSAAMAAGLQKGDVIVSLNEVLVTAQDMRKMEAALGDCATVRIAIKRAGRDLQLVWSPGTSTSTSGPVGAGARQ
jgi:hypothetical protein